MNQADAIRQKLREIEAANQVKILYAVESGSRAWGFASPDSDYDVRYVFIRTIKDYLRIDPLPDHIDGPLDEVQDYSGWDVKKALGLLGKSNPSLLEWLHSPIVYAQTAAWQHFADCADAYFSLERNLHHQYASAYSTWRNFLQGEQVRLKSTCMRCARCCASAMWSSTGRQRLCRLTNCARRCCRIRCAAWWTTCWRRRNRREKRKQRRGFRNWMRICWRNLPMRSRCWKRCRIPLHRIWGG